MAASPQKKQRYEAEAQRALRLAREIVAELEDRTTVPSPLEDQAIYDMEDFAARLNIARDVLKGF